MKKLKITEMVRLTSEAFHRETKLPILVVLDDVRSMNNAPPMPSDWKVWCSAGSLHAHLTPIYIRPP